ncbi:MAG: hypothetical protein FD168_1492 [Desulfobulbaceae bacterium]|nr:MAG: hypothetical protein FD168_1492 [Desulfobulbaceae bacterium]
MEEKISPKSVPPRWDMTEPIRNARLLLFYASDTGIILPPEIIKSIVEITHCHESEISAAELVEMETKFLQATEALAKAVSPVTVASLRAGYDKRDDTSLIGRFRGFIWRSSPKTSLAALSVRRFRLWALCTLILLLFVQIYWVIGFLLTADVAKTLAQDEADKIKKELLLLEQKQLNDRLDELRSAGKGIASDQNAMKRDLKILEDEMVKKLEEISAIDARRENSISTTDVDLLILNDWNGYWRWPVEFLGGFVSESSERSLNTAETAVFDSYQELLKSLKTATFVLHALQIYLLPILYGLLGATTYVLRTLARQIRDLTYTPESDIGFRLRMNLGALSGLAIVWFIKDGGNVQLPLASLSQFAVAFLAGYSVELLFTAMDRFVSVFSDNPKKEK